MLKRTLGLVAIAYLIVAPPADAAMAVIDVRAITQLRSQIRALEQQLDTARRHLDQARAEYEAMTGRRGMENLLSGTVRNYLPADWKALDEAVRNVNGAYQTLVTQVEAAIEGNAVLTPQQLERLSNQERTQLEAARRSTAMLQVTTQQALQATSGRFDAIQQLIDAIGTAEDPKAVMDLQARIAAEQAMLQNEQTKLQLMFQAAQAQEWARRQRAREHAIANIGSLRRLPPLGLND